MGGKQSSALAKARPIITRKRAAVEEEALRAAQQVAETNHTTSSPPSSGPSNPQTLPTSPLSSPLANESAAQPPPGMPLNANTPPEPLQQDILAHIAKWTVKSTATGNSQVKRPVGMSAAQIRERRDTVAKSEEIPAGRLTELQLNTLFKAARDNAKNGKDPKVIAQELAQSFRMDIETTELLLRSARLPSFHRDPKEPEIVIAK